MHDIFERICRYDLGQLLNTLINKDKLFSLHTLNDRIRFFCFEFDDFDPSINTPTLISVDAINKKHNLLSS